jgi:hypothetical protein
MQTDVYGWSLNVILTPPIKGAYTACNLNNFEIETSLQTWVSLSAFVLLKRI